MDRKHLIQMRIIHRDIVLVVILVAAASEQHTGCEPNRRPRDCALDYPSPLRCFLLSNPVASLQTTSHPTERLL
jgi:hypothetical protein